MTTLPPWAYGPFELLVHAEGHMRAGDDFDRRIALISFDNAIEVAITTYLTLHPIQRNGIEYNGKEVEHWLGNYHTKLEFVALEVVKRSATWFVERSHIVWAHDHRNEQYHGGQKGTPEKSVLKVVRSAAIWIFSLLFDVPDAETLLEQALLDQAPPLPPTRDRKYDVAIDDRYGLLSVGEQTYYASELLFSIDYEAYRDLGGRLCLSDTVLDGDEEAE